MKNDLQMAFAPMMSPRMFGGPHDEWRPNQLAAFNEVTGLYSQGGGFVFLELPTGSGKSLIPTALGHYDQVLTLVSTHGLLDQYEREYGFDIVKGMQAYPCVLEQRVSAFRRFGRKPTAADCPLKDMQQCCVADRCPYLIARDKALSSRRAACTYKYAALSSEMQSRDGILVMDECHTAGEEFLSLAEIVFTSRTCAEMHIPLFPTDAYGAGGLGDLMDKEARDKIKDWLADAGDAVGLIEGLPLGEEFQSKLKGTAAYIKRALQLVRSSQEVFMFVGQKPRFTDWLETDNIEENEMILVLKPLSVRFVARQIWETKKMVVLMSATVGNPNPLAYELGINEFQTYSHPHPIPVQYRPIYDLGLERMTHENLNKYPNLYRIQAKVIERFIDNLDPTWRGIVLAPSTFKVNMLRKFLSQKFGSRIFRPSYGKTTVSERINSFLQDHRHGLIAIDTIQGWGAGLDLRGDLARYSIVAGVPHANPHDRYTSLRMQQPGGRAYAFDLAYKAVPQASGRVSRGERDQYGDWLLNVSAIADGSAITNLALAHYPVWYRDAIQRPR